MKHAAVFGVGSDRAGIVAGVTGALSELGCNVERSHMGTLGGGLFSMMLFVSTEDVEQLERTLEERRAVLGLQSVSVSPVQPTNKPEQEHTHDIRVYCREQPGVIHTIACELLKIDKGGENPSITSLTSGVLEPTPEGPQRRECVVRLRVVAPQGATKKDLEGAMTIASHIQREEGSAPILWAIGETDAGVG